MPTTKRRINVTVSDEVYDSLERLSRSRDESLSHLSQQLLIKALELYEDMHFSKVADTRMRQDDGRRVPHSKAWR